jgi:hypothetical protein|tara:strand:+ start:994 stop:1251 length:258 start_codon:yes stop_codon:yes gene_type:complete
VTKTSTDQNGTVRNVTDVNGTENSNTTTNTSVGEENVTTSTNSDPVKRTTNVTKTDNELCRDCGKFPSSGDHPAGANAPVVPVVA